MRFRIFLMVTHLFLFIHDFLYVRILYLLHKKLFRIAEKNRLRQQKRYSTWKLSCAPKFSQKNVLATKEIM